jgi:hypothetical protein
MSPTLESETEDDRHCLSFACPVPPDLYAVPEYFSCLVPKIHKLSTIADDACLSCHIDVFGEAGVGKIIGGINPVSGSFAALCYPYCLPERFAEVSYANEAAFFFDGKSSGQR